MVTAFYTWKLKCEEYKQTSIRLREICPLDKSQIARSSVLYSHVSWGTRGEFGIKSIFTRGILASHEITAAVVRAIDPDLKWKGKKNMRNIKDSSHLIGLRDNQNGANNWNKSPDKIVEYKYSYNWGDHKSNETKSSQRLVLDESGKPVYTGEKPLGAELRTNKLNWATFGVEDRIEPRSRLW